MRGDAFKTLIVCRLSYQATEEDLEREFGRIGNIERVCLACIRNPGTAKTDNFRTDPHRPGHSRG